MLRAAVALVLLLLGNGHPRWKLDLPAGWAPVDPPALAEGQVLGSYAGRHGRRLVVARVRGNTDGAYAGDKAYFAGLEKGVRQRTRGYRRLSARIRTLRLGRRRRIPAYDLWYRTRAGVRGSRFVLMRGYAIVATIDLPHARRIEGRARRLLQSLAPVKAPAPP